MLRTSEVVDSANIPSSQAGFSGSWPQSTGEVSKWCVFTCTGCLWLQRTFRTAMAFLCFSCVSCQALLPLAGAGESLVQTVRIRRLNTFHALKMYGGHCSSWLSGKHWAKIGVCSACSVYHCTIDGGHHSNANVLVGLLHDNCRAASLPAMGCSQVWIDLGHSKTVCCCCFSPEQWLPNCNHTILWHTFMHNSDTSYSKVACKTIIRHLATLFTEEMSDSW